jgi:hypothetical protein
MSAWIRIVTLSYEFKHTVRSVFWYCDILQFILSQAEEPCMECFPTYATVY